MSSRPELVYDGDCAFCTSCVEFAGNRLAGGHGRPPWHAVPFQHADLAGLDARAGGRGSVTRQRAEYEVLWVTPTGEVHGGAQAIARLLMCAGGVWSVVGAAMVLPPVRWIAAFGYRMVARNRHRLPGGTPACALPAHRRP